MLSDDEALRCATVYGLDQGGAEGGDDPEDGQGDDGTPLHSDAQKWRNMAALHLSAAPFARVARTLADRTLEEVLPRPPPPQRRHREPGSSRPFLDDDSEAEDAGAGQRGGVEKSPQAPPLRRPTPLPLGLRIDVAAALSQLAADAVAASPPGSTSSSSSSRPTRKSAAGLQHATSLLEALLALVQAEADTGADAAPRSPARKKTAGGVMSDGRLAARAFAAALRPLLEPQNADKSVAGGQPMHSVALALLESAVTRLQKK